MGAKDYKAYKDTLKVSNVFTLGTAIFISLIMILFRKPIISSFTDINSVIEISNQYSIWLIIFPLVIGIGLVYYGIFSGISYTEPVRNSMIISLFFFLIVYYIFVPKFGNHGLWFAFIVFSLGRSVFLFLYKDKLNKRFLNN